MPLGSTQITSQTLEAMRSSIITSIFGRRFGLDTLGASVGTPEHRAPVDPITTTAATSLVGTGCSVLCATPGSSGIYSMLTPMAGTYKEITQTSTPALGFAIQLGAGALINTTAGSSFNQVTLSQQGASVNLFCISSSTSNGPVYAVTGIVSTGVVFSTY